MKGSGVGNSLWILDRCSTFRSKLPNKDGVSAILQQIVVIFLSLLPEKDISNVVVHGLCQT